ncbi:MAG: hypothetical protein J5764_02930 [Bacteroidales bacterium]|nr:hypothetical protein [Bacteroidales bacterium]
MKRRKLHIFLLAVLLIEAVSSVGLHAQFKENAFSQSYNDDKASPKDSTDVVFSFKEYFGGLAHKNTIKVGTSFAPSLILLGGQQIYNRQYWKLPIVYGATLAPLGAGVYYHLTGRQDISKWCWIGAGVAYWGTLLDGVICYKPDKFPQAGKATIYSILCPGAGQIYNKEYWKVPIYVGGMVAAGYFWSTNSIQYERYRRIYKEANDPEVPYTGPISSSTALYYRDVFRRYRDYSILAFFAVYLLQIIDANVFAYMHDFEMSDDLSMSISPTVIGTDMSFAMNNPSPAVGVGLNFRF